MKKMIIVISASAAVAVAAMGQEESQSNLYAKAQSALDAYVSQYPDKGFYRSRIGYWSAFTNRYQNDIAFRQAADSIFAEKPSREFLRNVNIRLFPAAVTSALAYVENDFPTTAAYHRSQLSGNPWHRTDGPLNTTLILESIAIHGVGTNPAGLEYWRKDILRQCSKSVRAKLRSEGKAIVGERGNSLAQARVDAVVSALNAPRFAGLEEALAACGSEISVPKSYPGVESDAEMSSITNAVFIGQIEFKSRLQAKMRFVLGLNAYNEFVDRYNSGN